MGDRTSVSIEIGGTITGAQARELAEAIIEEGIGEDYGCCFGDEEEALEYLVTVAKAGEPLRLMGSEMLPILEDLEATCRAIGLAYVRGDDGHYTYTAGVALWEPGMAEPAEWTGSVDSHTPRLCQASIRKFIAEGTLDAELDRMRRAENFATPLVISDLDALVAELAAEEESETADG
jgi:hypothetical protein